MSAALKSEPLETRPPLSHSEPQRQRRLSILPRASAPVVFSPLGPRDRPFWLRALVVSQRVSLGVAGLTVAAALSAYAMTVDTNRRLTAATTSLGQLQDHQQQLITANAVFKNHLAQTAIAAMNDGTLHPKDVIFLKATAAEPVTAEPQGPIHTLDLPNRHFFPKGY